MEEILNNSNVQEVTNEIEKNIEDLGKNFRDNDTLNNMKKTIENSNIKLKRGDKEINVPIIAGALASVFALKKPKTFALAALGVLLSGTSVEVKVGDKKFDFQNNVRIENIGKKNKDNNDNKYFEQSL